MRRLRGDGSTLTYDPVHTFTCDSPVSLSNLARGADRMINGQKPQRKRRDGHICELRSRTTVSILEQYETSQCFQRAFGKGGLLGELWMLLLRCQLCGRRLDADH